MKKKFLFLIFFVMVISINQALAQAGGINFMLGFPAGEFKENVIRTGFGLSGHFLLLAPTPERPFGIGINVGYLNYGQETRKEPFNPNIPYVTIDVETSNNLVNFHALFQLGVGSGSVRPFVEGLFGGSYIFTETTIRNESNNNEIASSTNFNDFAWSYGGGGGILILLHSGDEGDDLGALFLDIKARYLFGSEAEYLKEGSISVNNGKAIYQVSKSKTDLITAYIGVVAYFNSLFN